MKRQAKSVRSSRSTGGGLAQGRPRLALGLLLVLGAACLAGCDKSDPSGAGGADGRLRVVAAENFWGSIAAQLGGGRVSVRSIIVNPNT
ncbi:MAG TPA: hypothetical protein VFC30_06055, partial [Solirubrobacteraceae bacterium]|nr:hypothetical protein [Solirubrobacteraceae bacterium]